jgi:hypothetical protein
VTNEGALRDPDIGAASDLARVFLRLDHCNRGFPGALRPPNRDREPRPMNDTRKAHERWVQQDRIYGLIQLACAAIAVITAVYLMA